MRVGILTLALCLALPAVSRATSIKWTDTTGLWSIPANWSSNPALPGASDSVTIDSPGNIITLDVNAMIQSLSLGRRTTLKTLAGSSQSLSVANNIKNEGVIRLRHGSSLSAGGNFMNRGDVHLTRHSMLGVDGNLNNSGRIRLNFSSKLDVGGDFRNGRNGVLAGRIDSDVKVDGKFNNFGAVRLFGAGSHNGVMLAVGKEFNNFGTLVAQGGNGSMGAKVRVGGLFTNGRKGKVTIGGGLNGGTGGKVAVAGGFDNHGMVTVGSGSGNPAGGGGRLLVTGDFINARTGTVTLEGREKGMASNSRMYVYGGIFMNSGNVTIQDGSILSLFASKTRPRGEYIQKSDGAVTTNEGTIIGDVDIKAGEFTGNGGVFGKLRIAGTLLPGENGLGTTTVFGNYRQASTGVLDEVLAGTSPGQLGATDVAGSVTLLAGAALGVSFANGFSPVFGDSWTILDFEPGSLSGSFAYTPISLGNGNFLDIAYNDSAGDINLYVGDTAPTPEPASLLLFGTGLLAVAACWKRLQRPQPARGSGGRG